MLKQERNPWVVLAVLALGFFMTLLDTTIVNIAIPDMVTGLGASLDQVLWFVNAYTLVFVVLQLLGGRLGDRLGRRTVFIAGLVVFTLASLACGLATDPALMIAMRSLQGVGAAVLLPQTLALINAVFPAERRGAAFGVWSAVAGLAVIAGPTLGGFLVSTVGWQWIFFVNVPLGVIAVVAALAVVPNPAPGRRTRLDLPGVLLSTLGLFLVVFALIEGQRYRWGQIFLFVTVPLVLIAGVVVLVIFVLVQRARQERDPLLPFALFRTGRFSVAITLSMIIQFGAIGMLLPLTIYLQSVLGLSAIETGFVLAPPSVISIFLAPVAGNLLAKVGGRAILMPGLVLYGGGLALIAATARPDSSYWVVLPGLVLFGIGMGLVFAPVSTLALQDIPPMLAGAASGIFSTSGRLGIVLGTATVGLLLQNRLAAEVPAQAAHHAGGLPAALRGDFQNGAATAVDRGLDVGAGQVGGIPVPQGLPEPQARAFSDAAQQVFGSSFTAAAAWVLMATALVQLAGLALCFLLPRRQARTADPAGDERQAARA